MQVSALLDLAALMSAGGPHKTLPDVEVPVEPVAVVEVGRRAGRCRCAGHLADLVEAVLVCRAR